jgi:hypothetical protein
MECEKMEKIEKKIMYNQYRTENKLGKIINFLIFLSVFLFMYVFLKIIGVLI